MKVNMTKLFLISSISIFLHACAQLQPIKEPDVSLSGLSIASFSLERQELQLSFDVTNPNNQEIVIKGMRYLVIVDNKQLAKGRHEQKVFLPANSEQTVKIDVTTYLSEAAPIFKQLLFSPGEPIDYLLDLKVSISKPLPYLYKLNHSGTLDLI